MPFETAVAVAGITLVFAIFAVALAWANHYTNSDHRPGPAE